MSTEISEALTTKERKVYTKARDTIRKGLGTFVEVGKALKEIRDGRLYREDHGTFEAYCQADWGIGRTYAHRLIDSSDVLEVLPTGTKPTSERQARPLTQLDTPEEQAEAWGRAVETAPTDDAGNPKITAKHVAAVVEEMTAEPEPEPEPEDEPTGMHDYKGNLVPEAIEDNFDEEDLHKAISHIAAARSIIQAIGKRHAGDFLLHAKCRQQLLETRREVKASAMFALCPECNGARCLSCRSAGSVPKATYLQMTEDENE